MRNELISQLDRYITLAKSFKYSLVFINGESSETIAKSGYLEKSESNEIKYNFSKLLPSNRYVFYNNPSTFVGDVFLNLFKPRINNPSDPVFLYSVAQIGLDINRRSFIPNFASRYNIHQLASSGYQLELLQDKVTFLQIAKDYVLVPKTSDYKDINNKKKFFDSKLHIIKPNFENSSRGVCLVKSMKQAEQVFEDNKQNFPESKELVQEYIQGIEVESPVLVGDIIIPLGVKKVNKKNKILDQVTIDSEAYNYEDFSDETLVTKIKDLTVILARRFEVKGFARFDFMIDLNNKIWLFDIAALPLITEKSSIQSCFSSLKLSQSAKYLAMIGSSISNII